MELKSIRGERKTVSFRFGFFGCSGFFGFFGSNLIQDPSGVHSTAVLHPEFPEPECSWCADTKAAAGFTTGSLALTRTACHCSAEDGILDIFLHGIVLKNPRQKNDNVILGLKTYWVCIQSHVFLIFCASQLTLHFMQSHGGHFSRTVMTGVEVLGVCKDCERVVRHRYGSTKRCCTLVPGQEAIPWVNSTFERFLPMVYYVNGWFSHFIG